MSITIPEDMSSKSPKTHKRGADALAGVAFATKTTIKFVKSFTSLKSDIFKPFHPSLKSQLSMRPSLVAEEKLGENVNFNDPVDQKLIADILALRPQRRREDEIAFLKKAFEDIEFFKQIESEMDETSFTTLFQSLRLEFFKAGQKVFSYGDIGKTFYIIIKGSAYILLKSEGVVHTDDETQASPQSIILQNEELIKSRENLGAYLQSDISQEAKKEIVEKCYPDFWLVQEKIKGDSFGDLALNETGNRLRTATVVCSDDAVFGTLCFNDYQSILGALQKKKFTENVDCLFNVDIFKHWKENQISSLLLSVDELKLARNQIIFKEGDVPKLLYFIKQGEVELRKVVDIDNTDEQADDFGPSLMNRPNTTKTKVWKKQEAMRLGILTKGDYFGEAEMLSLKPREYSAIVYSSEVVLISIPRDKFLSFVKDKTSLQKFEAHIREKKQWRDNLIRKLVNLRVDKSVRPNTQQTVPKINLLRRTTLGTFTEDQMDSPTIKSAALARKPLEERAGSLLLDEKNDLQIPLLSARNIRSIQAFPGSIPSSPQGKRQDDISPLKSNKEKSAKLMSAGFSFSQMKMMGDKSPLYERQKERIEKKLQQERQEQNQNMNRTETTQADTLTRSSSLKIKVTKSPKFISKGPNLSPKLSIVPSIDLFDSSPSRVKTTKEKIRISHSISENPMIKMCKQLGLDKIYSEKDMHLVSLDGRICSNTMQTLTSLPRVVGELNRASSKEKMKRPGSVHNLRVKIPGNSTAR